MTPPDFIEDDSFRRWTFTNAPEDAAYWEDYLTRHPEHRERADLARTFLLTARGTLPDVTDQQVQDAVKRILVAAPAPSQSRGLIRSLVGWSYWPSVSVAAAVALVMTAGWLGWQHRSHPKTMAVVQPQGSAPRAIPMTELVNRQSAPRLVQLTDGSLVILQRDARIRFPKRFDGPRRDVFLTGNAFFEVVRNPAKPFRVYTGELTTEVVGTSFLINAPQTGGRVKVVVRTGKVAVSTHPVFDRGRSVSVSRSPAKAVILLPNQQATFSTGDGRLVKSSVNRATAPTLPAITPVSFRRTPLPLVLDALARAYGITIRFNRDELANCTLTARLDDPSLFARLDVIAASTGSTYELLNGQLVMHSAGCR